MKLKSIGRANCHELELDNGVSVLFSYETPVAISLPGVIRVTNLDGVSPGVCRCHQDEPKVQQDHVGPHQRLDFHHQDSSSRRVPRSRQRRYLFPMIPKTEFYRISSDFFVWSGNRGVCDITDLPPEAPFHRSPRDPFDVCSSKTKEVKHFFFLVTLYDAEGEVIGWRYRSNGGEFEIDIIND